MEKSPPKSPETAPAANPAAGVGRSLILPLKNKIDAQNDQCGGEKAL